MTEPQIERIAEAKMDKLDADLMAGRLSQAEYEDETAWLRQWVNKQHRRAHLRTR